MFKIKRKCQYDKCDNYIPEDRINRGKRSNRQTKYCSKRCCLKANEDKIKKMCPHCCEKKISRKAEMCRECKKKLIGMGVGPRYVKRKEIDAIDFKDHLKDPESLFQSCDIIKRIIKEE